MATRRYWKGFAAGAAAGAGAAFGSILLASWFRRRGYVERFEKTVQIGRPVEEVFSAWSDLQNLPRMSRIVNEVRVSGNRSHWNVGVEGKQVEWDADIGQLIPNQAIGWKSISGPKHTGRISFSPLGNDTIVHMTMNYAPPSLLLRPFVHPVSGRMAQYIEQVLRDFKAALEGKGQEHAIRTGPMHTAEPSRATGTFGGSPVNPVETKNTRFGGPPSPVEYTRPPEAKS